MIIPIEITNTSNITYNITIDKLKKLDFDTNVVIVTNTTISALHLETLKALISATTLNIVTILDGEKYKTLETVESILNQCFEHKLDRKSLLIAFGGGVIGDMTGFCASLYQRGIDFIQIPTTLLSQVDASVGGKTGVNNSYGKNLIGAFYQPKAVYIDIDFLSTLPLREFSAGIAEIVKMAVMFDKSYFEFLQKANFQDKETLKQIIKRSVELKAWVVNQDEKEAGIRAVLNYGHTFGHIVENETNYNTYLHGEAVSIGIIMVNALAFELGLMRQEEMALIQTFLNDNNLPTSYHIKDIDSFYEHLFLDKKSAKGRIKFILPNGIGQYKIVSDIEETIIKKVLAKFGESE